MERVLIIDDEPMICEIVSIALRLGGRFETESGSSGTDLRALLEAHPDVVAVICDCHLVGENGLTIHKQIEPTLRDRRIAFLLLHGSGPDLRKSLPEGYFERHGIVELTKPMPSIMDFAGLVEAEVERLRPR